MLGELVIQYLPRHYLMVLKDIVEYMILTVASALQLCLISSTWKYRSDYDWPGCKLTISNQSGAILLATVHARTSFFAQRFPASHLNPFATWRALIPVGD
jgi:hypothetical protein